MTIIPELEIVSSIILQGTMMDRQRGKSGFRFEIMTCSDRKAKLRLIKETERDVG